MAGCGVKLRGAVLHDIASPRLPAVHIVIVAAEQERKHQPKHRAGQHDKQKTAVYGFSIRGKRVKSLSVAIESPEKDACENDCADDEKMKIRPETDRTGLVGFAGAYHRLLCRLIERDCRRDLLRIVGPDKLRRTKPCGTGGCFAVKAESECKIDIALLCSGSHDQRFARPVKAAGASGADSVSAVERVVIDRKAHAASAVNALGGNLRRKAVDRIRLHLDHLAEAHIILRGGGDDQRAVLCINGIILRFICHDIPPVRKLRRRKIGVHKKGSVGKGGALQHGADEQQGKKDIYRFELFHK